MNRLDTTLSAVANPARRAILSRLARGPATVGELVRPAVMSQQAVSKHIAFLERAGLVQKNRVGRQHVCTLNPEPMKEMAQWLEGFRSFWEESFDRLEAVLQEMQKGEPT